MSRFDRRYAAEVASWVQSDRELTWLAPGTPPPLTAEKVSAWGGRAEARLLYWTGDDDLPDAYSELNYMPNHRELMWIGHFIVRPARRGRAIGVRFARALLEHAFGPCRASMVLLVVFPDNAAAVRCYERAGFVRMGRERKYFETTRREHVFLRMGVDRKRFERLQAAAG